jgi:rhodanese-related sulfurtransferase
MSCSRFDTQIAGKQDRTALVQIMENAPFLGAAHKNGKNASPWCKSDVHLKPFPSTLHISFGAWRMNSVEDILAAARGRVGGQPYAGAVTPQEAYALVQADPRIKLVDVRTNAERDWVGRVALPAAQHGAVQWSTWPGGVPNPDFVAQLAAFAGQDEVLLFLCRSGVRSRHAAALATQHGYANSFDILEGFEGDKDGEGHRKTVGGWCHAGLPWLGA